MGWTGSNIHVPGIVTDIWANKRAGEMTSNCSTTGLHQQATIGPSPLPVRFGECIKSPHPLDRQFTFHIYLKHLSRNYPFSWRGEEDQRDAVVEALAEQESVLISQGAIIALGRRYV